jgi:RHS repeat-associated protein
LGQHNPRRHAGNPHPRRRALTQQGQTSLSYDAKGNLTQDKNGRKFTWDQDNKLAAADLDGDETDDATYAYDALGRRVTKVYNGLTTLYARAGWQTLAEYENSGSGYQLARKFVYGDYVDEPLVMIRLVEEKKTVGTGTETESEIGITPAPQMTEQKYYYHANANYNIAAMTNQAGTVVEQYRYSAYGLPVIIQTANIGNPFHFTGKRYDAELAWYDYNFRPFEPEQGRFPVREDEYRNTVNSYQYCNAAPLHKTDPTGKVIVVLSGAVQGEKYLDPLKDITRDAILYEVRDYDKNPAPQMWVSRSSIGPLKGWYDKELEDAYEKFVQRKSTQKCSLEQFVAIGHSSGASAIFNLLKAGKPFATKGKYAPVYVAMIDAVYPSERIIPSGNERHDLSGKLGEIVADDFYGAWRHEPIIGASLSFNIKLGGAVPVSLRTGENYVFRYEPKPDIGHLETVQSKVVMDLVPVRAREAYMKKVESEAKEYGIDKWDTRPEENGW